jgi:SAM-dependent methyltransferase
MIDSESSSSREGGFPPEAFEQLAGLERGTYWFESRNRLIVWAVRRYFPAAGSLLEIGCGTGFVLTALRQAFPRMRLTASDAMPGGLEVARSRVPDAVFQQQDARALDAREEFDIVCAFDVLEHIPDDVDVMQRLHAAARTGGGAIITVPQHPQLWGRGDEYGHHVRRYRRRELVERMERAGFRMVRVTSFVSLLLPLMAASRLLDRNGTRAFDPCREFHVPAAVNRVLNSVLAIERLAITLGLSWPAGGSLLVVARKD